MTESSPPALRCTATDGKRVVATSPILTIEACACGVVHLHFGPMTLRFTECSIDMLYRTLAEARAELAAEGAAVPVLHVHEGGPVAWPDSIDRADVLDPVRYEQVRPRYRELLAALRSERRVRLGDSAVVLFENRETVLWQVHEVLRCEGANPRRIRRVLADYDPILPRPFELRATVLIDDHDAGHAREIATALGEDGGLDLRCGGSSCPSMPAAPPVTMFDPVWYLRWRPPAEWIERLCRSDVALSLHPRWTTAVVIVPMSTRRQLGRDLEGSDGNAPSLLHRLQSERRGELDPSRGAKPTARSSL